MVSWVVMVITSLKYVTTCLQNKFLNSFKSTVNKHLLTAEALEPNDKDWNNSNFVDLYIRL